MSKFIKTKLNSKGTLVSELCTSESFSAGGKVNNISYWDHYINGQRINIFRLLQQGEIDIETYRKLSNLPKK